ncbi:MAG: tetratricopeptide repeat protein [Candidatus Saccharibacteria bacterium]|nr:tetratricopeptide repeat protein [Candidatus Saccharibacteria bacterium]
MFGLLFIIIAGVAILLYRPKAVKSSADTTAKITEKLDKLWQIAQDALKDQKYLRAEKALLTILRVDERNATAYNRLGILYAKQQAYKDAIECFEIAQSLEPSASSLHNVGLIYLETDNLDKAALAFEQAMTMEENVASRHIAYAKVLQKMGRDEKAIASFEKAVELDRSAQSLRILADAYARSNKPEKAAAIQKELDQQLTPRQTAVRNKTTTKSPRKVVM